MKTQTSQSGWFGKLPVLHYDDQLISETTVINQFLLKVTGDADAFDENHFFQHCMLTSSLYSELMAPMGILVWSELAFPGSTLEKLAPATVGRIQEHLTTLESTLVQWSWWSMLKQRPPVVTDFLLWEMLSIAKVIFGDAINLSQYPQLNAFYEHFEARPLCETLLGEKPPPFTACPDESAVITRIHKITESTALP